MLKNHSEQLNGQLDIDHNNLYDKNTLRIERAQTIK
jgi:hypothetical protein